jgi:serine/threonine protein kinase HipA of HipAB toxin-antitoxin module
LETRGTCGRGNLFTTIADIFSFFGFFIYPEDPECSRCQRSKHRPHVAKTLPRDELSHIIEEVWDLSTFRHAGLASWNVQLTQVRRSLSLSLSSFTSFWQWPPPAQVMLEVL